MQIASSGKYKTWICLLSGDEQVRIKALVQAAEGVRFVSIPLDVSVLRSAADAAAAADITTASHNDNAAPQLPDGMTTETARKVEQAMHYVQKPVIVQVSVLWLGSSISRRSGGSHEWRR